MTETTKPVPLEQGEHPFTGIFIAIPCGSGAIRHETVISLIETMSLFSANKIYGEIRIAPQDSLIMRARNTLVAWFMASKCSHMMCIDDDLKWDARDVLKFLKADKDFVSGAYRRKSDNETYTVAFPKEAGNKLVVCAHCGCVELDASHVGFAMLHRRVFERMFEAYPALKCDNPPTKEPEIIQHFYALFNELVEEGKMWGEDYSFSRLWKRAGGRIWLDPSIDLTHYGTKGWTGNIGRWFLKTEHTTISVTDEWKEIEGWLTDSQAAVILEEMRFVPIGGTVVELGSWKGRSTALLGMGAAQADREIRVYAVDHFFGSPDELGIDHHDAQLDDDGVYPEFLENLSKIGVLGSTVVPIRATFEAALTELKDGTVDLMFIDGDHGAGETLRVFDVAEAKVKPGGCVIFHDYNWPKVRADLDALKLDVSEVHEMAVWRKPKEEAECSIA